MDEREWQTFLTVVSEGSITKAAKKLFLSQPALSYRLRHMEEVLENPLLVKQNDRLVLTPQGELFYEYCQRMMREREALIQTLGAINEEVCGTLSIGASINFSDYELPRLLAAFVKKYPQIHIKVRTGYSQEIKKIYNSGEVHVAIVRGVMEEKEYVQCLIEEPYCLVHKTPVTIADLVDIPMIQYRTDGSIAQVMEAWCKRNLPKDITPAMELDSMVTCRHFIREGLGWSILPFMGLGACKEEGIYVKAITDVSGHTIKRNTYLLHNEKSQQLKATRVFIDFIRAHYGQYSP